MLQLVEAGIMKVEDFGGGLGNWVIMVGSEEVKGGGGMWVG